MPKILQNRKYGVVANDKQPGRTGLHAFAGVFHWSRMKNTSKHRRGLLIALLLCLCLFLFSGAVHAQRSRREAISVNTDVYEVSVRRDGAVHVHSADGTPIFAGVQARVLYGDAEQFRRLRAYGRETMRFQVNDALGQGQGLAVQGRACDWRINTYPGKPYFSVRLVYRNTRNTPVTVAALAPWFISPATNGAAHVGQEAAQATVLRDTGDGLRAHDHTGESDTLLAIENPAARRLLFAGALTHQYATSLFQLARSGDANAFTSFQAISRFDPPVVVPPGETLESESLYISVADSDVIHAFEGYGEALAATHGLPRSPRRIMSGLDSGSHAMVQPPSSQQLIELVTWQERALGKWRWRHFTVGEGWELRPGDWQPAPERFPEGFAPLVSAAREAQITLGLRFRPFLVDPQSELAQNNPEWLLDYEDEDGLYVLDVSRPDVRQWLTGLANTLTRSYGFQTLFLAEADCLLRCALPDNEGLTRVAFLRLGLQAIRAGLDDRHTLAVSPWHPAAIPYADMAGMHGTEHVDWRHVLEREALISGRHYLNAAGITLDSGLLFFGDGEKDETENDAPLFTLNPSQQIASAVAATLHGAPLRLGSAPDALSDADKALLGRLSPPLHRSAYVLPDDRNTTTSIRHLPLVSDAGEWHIVAFFNWSRMAETTARFNLGALGLAQDTPYTLYEFLPGAYHGLIRGGTSLALPPASVRLFGLRPYEGIPMLIASDRHISQGAYEHRQITWDAAEKRLTGVFQADPVSYRLRFLVPEPWELVAVQVSADNVDIHRDKKYVVIVAFTVEDRQDVSWQIDFE